MGSLRPAALVQSRCPVERVPSGGRDCLPQWHDLSNPQADREYAARRGLVSTAGISAVALRCCEIQCRTTPRVCREFGQAQGGRPKSTGCTSAGAPKSTTLAFEALKYRIQNDRRPCATR